MEIRPLTQAEQKYAYRQSMQISGQTGSVGVLQGRYGTGKEFDSVFHDMDRRLKTDEFEAGLSEVMHDLCSNKSGFLQNLDTMREYMEQHPQNAVRGRNGTEYGFRADTEIHAFLMRCDPTGDDYNVEIHCYVKGRLDSHIREAEKGIRFIDSRYNELFRIADGEGIKVRDAWGHTSESTCRYIDEYHTEIANTLFHICQYAELMEQLGSVYTPAGPGTGRTDEKILEFEHWTGTTEQVTVDVGCYPKTGGLHVSLFVPLDAICQDPYGDVTVNFTGSLPAYCALADTKCVPELEEFLVKNRIGKFTGLQQNINGYDYPLYQFDADKLKELCPYGTESYEHANGLDKKTEKKEKSR